MPRQWVKGLMPMLLSSLALRENEYAPSLQECNASNRQLADEKGPNMAGARALTIESHISRRSFPALPLWQHSSMPQHVPAIIYYPASPSFRSQFLPKWTGGSTGIQNNRNG